MGGTYIDRDIPDLSTLPAYFYHWVSAKPNHPFLRQPYGDSWKTISYKSAYEEAASMASALKNMGLQPGDHVAIMSKNCYHWILADLAIMMGGFVSIPLYFSLSGNQLAEVLELSDSKALFIGKLENWTEAHGQAVSTTVKTISFPLYEGNARIEADGAWEELVQQNTPIEKPSQPKPSDLWTILFTSGTTGTPKGAMHRHGTPAQIVKDDAANGWIGITQYENPKFFSYLPLNHVGEKIGVYTTALITGGTISFAESINTFAKNLQDTQPTLFFAVPRIWTKFHLGVLEKLPEKRQQLLFKVPLLSGFLKRKIRTGLGMRDAKIVATGAALTPAHLKQWYKKLGIHLIEAYGMTEVCGSISNSPMHEVPADSVGKAVPGCEVKIDPESGEILMKSPYMMQGYYKDQTKTEQVLKGDWLHSGDRGSVDPQGYIRVTGRIGDSFKTSKGKFITPNGMEMSLLKSELIEQVCVVGLGIPQPIALVNLSEIGLGKSKESVTNELANLLDTTNKELANYQRISTIVVDSTTWDTENALLTPTLKIRRAAIDEAYGKNYEHWHCDKKKVIWI